VAFKGGRGPKVKEENRRIRNEKKISKSGLEAASRETNKLRRGKGEKIHQEAGGYKHPKSPG